MVKPTMEVQLQQDGIFKKTEYIAHVKTSLRPRHRVMNLKLKSNVMRLELMWHV